MIKLNAGISRKIGEPNYGSRGASVNLELELESHAFQDPQQLHDKIRRLFAMAKSAVDEELGMAAEAARADPPSSAAPQSSSQSPSPPSPVSSANGNRPATESQLRAIRAISQRLGLDPDEEAERLVHRPAAQLRLQEASKLIDHLKQVLANQESR